MKKIFFLFVLLLPVMLFSKNDSLEVIKSEPYTRVEAKEKLYFEFENQIIFIKLDKEFIVLQKFDTKLNKILDRKSFAPLKPGSKIEKLLFLGNEYYLVYSYWDKKTKVEYLYSRQINKESIRLGEEKIILKSENKLAGVLINYGYFKYSVEDKYQFRFSENKQNLLIASKLKPKQEYNRKYHAEIILSVFDNDFQKVSSRTIEMPSVYILTSYYDYTITNSGVVYILSDVYENEYYDYYSGKDKNYHIELLRIDEKEIKTILINEKDFYIKKIQITNGNNDEIYIGGYYLDRGLLNGVDGLFYCKVERDVVSDINYFPFSLEFINFYEDENIRRKNERKLKKDKLDYPNLELKELIVTEGGLIIVGEQFEENTATSVNGGSSFNSPGITNVSSKTTYSYGDLILGHIHKEELDWLYKIPKNQTVPDKKDYFFYAKKTNGVGNNSYKIIKKEDVYNIIYWDKSSNKNIDKSRSAYLLENGEWGVLMNAQIDLKTGFMKKERIFKPSRLFSSENTLIRDWYFNAPLKNVIPFNSNTKIFIELDNYGLRKPKQDVSFQIEL